MTRGTQVGEAAVELSELATQLRDLPGLRPGEVDELLDDLRANGTDRSRQRLVESNLAVALDEARERSGRGVAVIDLYQEGTLAVMVAVQEYASRDAPAAGLAGFARRVVAAHLDATIEAAELEHREKEAFVRDAQLFQTADVALGRKLGRQPSTTELASVLEWPADRVELIAGMLGAARTIYDEDIARYLDDE